MTFEELFGEEFEGNCEGIEVTGLENLQDIELIETEVR